MRTLIMTALATLTLSTAAHADILSVCARTVPVKDFIEQGLHKSCADITEADLATLTRVAVPDQNISALQVGDFSGLPNLEILNIKGNPYTTLPEGLFAGLPKLKTLVIFETGLVRLPDDFLVGLDNLENLYAFSNSYTTLAPAVVDRLTALKHLHDLDLNDRLDPALQAQLSQVFPAGGQVVLSFY